MTFADDLADDYGVFDDVTTVWLTQSGASPLEISGVLSGVLERPQLNSAGDALGLESIVRTFSLPSQRLGAVLPTGGDTITDGQGTVWRVMSAKLLTLSTRWLVTCRKDN